MPTVRVRTSGGWQDVSIQGAQSPDATTLVKGLVQLAGDLAGTAASPQIAAGAIVDADINAAAAIAYTKLGNWPIGKCVSGSFSYSAADTNRRPYTPTSTDTFDPSNMMSTSIFTAPVTGKYLVGMAIDQISAAGNIMVGHFLNNTTILRTITCNCALGTDANFKGGASLWEIHSLTATDNIRYLGWHSGGGSAVLTVQAIWLPI